LGGEFAGGGKIRKGHASVWAEEIRSELVGVTGGSSDVHKLPILAARMAAGTNKDFLKCMLQ
jgi:hypothetical protein